MTTYIYIYIFNLTHQNKLSNFQEKICTELGVDESEKSYIAEVFVLLLLKFLFG